MQTIDWVDRVGRYDGPRYRAIADAMSDMIDDGVLADGIRLPPQRTLAWTLGVTLGTVTRAYDELHRRGLTSGEVGRGTYVRTFGHSPSTQLEHLPDQLIDMGINRPTTIATPAMRDSLAELARSPSLDELMTYQPHAGRRADRQAAGDWLHRFGLSISIDNLVICSGAQHGLLLALEALTRPGDVVFAECLTYPGFKAACVARDVRLHGLEMDDQGIVPAAFEAACRSMSPRIIYLMPGIHNPTGIRLSLDRRQTIADIARRHGVMILEDEVYAFINDDAPPPLVTLAPDITVHVTGLSKPVAPGLRVGYVVAPAPIIQRLFIAIRASTFMATPLTVALASDWIRNGIADGLRIENRDIAHRRYRIAREHLSSWVDLPDERSAGHIWFPLPGPWTTTEFVTACRSRGVLVTPVDAFATTTTRGSDRPAVRVSVAAPPTDDQVSNGLATLADILRTQSPAISSVI